MSIFEETGGALTGVAHDRSLELFFDRYEAIARFVSLINEDPVPRRLSFLYGLGGNGKSLLLRYLAARCCVRLPPGEWERMRRLPDAELPAALAGVAKAARVPVARIDFGARPVGENRPQECFSALFMLKQQLAQYRIGTPRFDFAAVTYLHKVPAVVAHERGMSESLLLRWARGEVWFERQKLIGIIIAVLLAVPYVTYIYPLPRAWSYYVALMHQPWVPDQSLTLSTGHEYFGYPMATDSKWLVVVSSDTRIIQYIPISDVTSRTVCRATLESTVTGLTPPPLIPIAFSVSPPLPPCRGTGASSGLNASADEHVLRWTSSMDTTSSRVFRPIARLGGPETCTSGQLIATLSIELRRISAGFRIQVDKKNMNPGAVRFVPSGLHDSFSFTFIWNVPSSGNRQPILNVEWRSPTGHRTTLERGTLNAECAG